MHNTAQWLDHKRSFSWIILRKAWKTDDVDTYSPATPANHHCKLTHIRHFSWCMFNFSFWTRRTTLNEKNFSLNNRHNECYCCFHWCATCSYILTSQKCVLGFHDTLISKRHYKVDTHSLAVWGSWRSLCCGRRWLTWWQPWRPNMMAYRGAGGLTD